MTESIIFLIVETKSKIIFATSIANHFAKNLGHQYTKVIKTILHYLKDLRDQEITYKGHNKLRIEGYLNSN